MSSSVGRGWGVSEYRFATDALREGRTTRPFQWFIGVACLLLAVLAAVVQFHPDGPHGAVAHSVQIAILVSAVLVGLRWLIGPWPSHPWTVAYVVWADCALAATSITMSTPAARLSTTLYMSMLGIFCIFILGARPLYLHCAFCAVVIVSIVAWAMVSDPSAGFDLFVYYMPALVWVVFAPAGALILINRGRAAIGRTARAAHYDALTGLRNRRGLHATVDAIMIAKTECLTVIVAVCDVDQFKRLNDRLGHSAGDMALIGMAQKLAAIAHPDEITARIGGDELVLVSIHDDPSAIDDLPRRLAPLTQDVDANLPTASVGVAWNITDDPHFSIDNILRHADSAMYEAKRAGGGRCAVYRPGSSVTVLTEGADDSLRWGERDATS